MVTVPETSLQLVCLLAYPVHATGPKLAMNHVTGAGLLSQSWRSVVEKAAKKASRFEDRRRRSVPRVCCGFYGLFASRATHSRTDICRDASTAVPPLGSKQVTVRHIYDVAGQISTTGRDIRQHYTLALLT